jgi:SanA protein
MLYDRIMTGVSLYKAGVSARIIMSGDHGRSDYNEVGTMKEYAVNEGVPSEDIFMDHAGFSTYESLYRAKEIFGADRIIIVSQEYHLYRALYIAKALGIEAYGVSADLRSYSGQYKRELREILARNKDFILAIAKPVPSVLGDSISLDGSGDVTND